MSTYVSQLIFLKESDNVWIAEFYLLCHSPKEMMEGASYKRNDIDSLTLISHFVYIMPYAYLLRGADFILRS